MKIQITDPDGKLVWQMPVQHEVEFVFSPRVYGNYKICFINQRETSFADLVYVDFDRSKYTTEHKEITKPHGVGDKSAMATDKDTREIRQQLMMLASKLNVLVGEQRLVQHRYSWQLEHAKLIRWRTIWFMVLEVAALLLVGAFQVYMIRAMFSDGSRGRRRGQRVIKGLFNTGPGLPTARMNRLAI